MYKESGCSDVFLAAVILVFSFWQITASRCVIIVAAALIFLKGIVYLSKYGCTCIGKTCRGLGGHKIGSELMMEKSKPIKPEPSKQEIKEVLKGKKKVVKAVK